MCRRIHMWAFVTIAFGIGLLIGLWIESGFVQGCLGIGFIGLGIFLTQRK